MTTQAGGCLGDSWSREAHDQPAGDTSTTNGKRELTWLTDGFGIEQKSIKKAAVAPLPRHRRKLCLENEDENSGDTYVVFPEKALGTQRASLLPCFSSATHRP